ncbi:hypothetical protein PAXINDRAFT_10127 [Paxillus involutus ATCC 200175]|nr:hypothetical protein PAXINDRAFT_10127 [Paxillus involutus ATCC 200175]
MVPPRRPAPSVASRVTPLTAVGSQVVGGAHPPAIPGPTPSATPNAPSSGPGL